MFLQYFVLIIVLVKPIEMQKVLEFSSFTDDTFTDFDGWNLVVVEQQGSGIDKPPSVTQSYFGFNSIFWDRSNNIFKPFGTHMPYQGMIKYHNNLKPHKALIISFQIYIYNDQIYPTGDCHVYFNIDGLNQYHIYTIFSPKKRLAIQNTEVTMTHSASSAFIQFAGVITDSNKVTYGIRDFNLYSIPCPNNCQHCSRQDKQEYECIEWSLSFESLLEIDRNIFNSDGWSVIQESPSMQIKKSTNCMSENINSMQILGYLEMQDKMRRTIILEPHYRIKIQYLHIVLEQAVAPSTYWQGQLNGKTMFLVGFQTFVSSPEICSKLIDKTRGDLVSQVEYEAFHQDTLVEFQTSANQQIIGWKTKWGIRNFQVFIKKCHSTCQNSCFGPKETQCENSYYSKFILFANNLRLATLSDDEDWQVVTPFQFTQPNECNNQALLGGYNNLQGKHFLQSVYDLKTHVKIGLSFKIYYIDQFNDDILYVAVDGIVVYQYTIPSTVDPTKDMPYCGVYAKIDQVMKITITTILHTRSQAIIEIYTNQPNTSTGYWGIREFILTVNGFPYLKNLNVVKFSNAEITPWKIILQNSPIWSCGSKQIVGGSTSTALDQDSFLKRQFLNLPPHIQIRISFSIVTIQASLRETQFIFTQTINDEKKQEYLDIEDKKFCGGTEYTHNFKFDYILDNSDESIFMIFKMEQLNVGEYWGIRDFQLSHNNVKTL
ncbi:unnamed protein product (macronuclear) [Paramecium tetraurelia]|uniref:Uncharacterized protein n=1 Tax=Paramecium tetraurelia TaxID=5888 RepID=A0DMV9_PARTE|nr:uncharacterized protein GSPATT00018581001 [Paramecium tetraurelia]CAK84376.1 unnamed protein product [Paramecium tetraurelia]|eukprot:XP_001451773.1 hypothetical protein (macronuclear) [Paramecium tetraurelia strain d4-2]